MILDVKINLDKVYLKKFNSMYHKSEIEPSETFISKIDTQKNTVIITSMFPNTSSKYFNTSISYSDPFMIQPYLIEIRDYIYSILKENYPEVFLI